MTPSRVVPDAKLPVFLRGLGTTYRDLRPKPGSLMHAMRLVKAKKRKKATP